MNCGRKRADHIPEEGSLYCPLTRHFEEDTLSGHHVDEAIGGAHQGEFGVSNVIDTREDVYRAIDSERDYQEMRKQRDGGNHHHSPTEFLVYMKSYLNEALEAAARKWGPSCNPAILEIVRKVTALGIACMEENGAPQRVGFEHYAMFNDEKVTAALTLMRCPAQFERLVTTLRRNLDTGDDVATSLDAALETLLKEQSADEIPF